MDVLVSISPISEHTIQPGTESVFGERDSEVLGNAVRQLFALTPDRKKQTFQ